MTGQDAVRHNVRMGYTRNTHLLTTHHEIRATVSYSIGGDVKSFDGWVMLDEHPQGARVMARNYRGRNRWYLTRVADVLSVREVR